MYDGSVYFTNYASGKTYTIEYGVDLFGNFFIERHIESKLGKSSFIRTFDVQEKRDKKIQVLCNMIQKKGYTAE